MTSAAELASSQCMLILTEAIATDLIQQTRIDAQTPYQICWTNEGDIEIKRNVLRFKVGARVHGGPPTTIDYCGFNLLCGNASRYMVFDAVNSKRLSQKFCSPGINH